MNAYAYLNTGKARPGAGSGGSGGGVGNGRIDASPTAVRTSAGRTGVGRAGQVQAQQLAAQGGVPAGTAPGAGGEANFVLQTYKPGMSTGTLVAFGLGGAALIFGIIWAVRRRGGN